MLGGYERDPAPWSVDGVPDDFNNRLLPEDWDRFAPLMTNACQRVPAAEHADIVQLVNGPEGFTPDNEFVLGESEVPASSSPPGSAPTASPAPAASGG